MSQDESIAACEKLFAKYLDGHALQSNASHLVGSAAWLNFKRIKCERWASGNVILLGDAAHTAHFSIGSGTKLALEDAIKLAEVLSASSRGARTRSGRRCNPRIHETRRRGEIGDNPLLRSPPAALDEYQAERNLEVLKLQNSARNSTEWFETLGRYLHFEPLQFAYSLLTRSQRISHENLRLRDREWLEGVERWFWERAGVPGKSAAPMFAPFKLRALTLENRITVSPMAMYSAVDGIAGRLPLRSLRRARFGRRRAAVHGDDLRLARRPDQPRLHRHVERRACRRVDEDRRFRPRKLEGENLPPARPFGRQGLDPNRLGRQ